ncbi:phage head closure protein [Bacillus sp. FSL W8-0445]|jgi:SPP1 family predicted phage head-tail adaptor|nr:phage head closure protein [Bacillus licheniformis]MDE1375024.1 phage head closure protein [Bacillus licheniformis]MDZ5538917.1 phage head closure protein [Bacillus licheniformis]
MMYEEFPHTITFQKFEQIPNGGGGFKKEWVDAITDCEAFVDSLTGKEYYQAQQLENPVEYNVYFPYREDVKNDMRIIWKDRNDRVLVIQSPPIDQGGQGEILCFKCRSGENIC